MPEIESIIGWFPPYFSGSTDKMLKIELTRYGYLLFDSSAVSQFPGFTVEMTFGKDMPVKGSTISKPICFWSIDFFSNSVLRWKVLNQMRNA